MLYFCSNNCDCYICSHLPRVRDKIWWCTLAAAALPCYHQIICLQALEVVYYWRRRLRVGVQLSLWLDGCARQSVWGGAQLLLVGGSTYCPQAAGGLCLRHAGCARSAQSLWKCRSSSWRWRSWWHQASISTTSISTSVRRHRCCAHISFVEIDLSKLCWPCFHEWQMPKGLPQGPCVIFQSIANYSNLALF